MSITTRKVNRNHAEEVLERDEYCRMCGRPGENIHHVFFGGEAEYGPGRNLPNKLILLCQECHLKHAHGSEIGRRFCIDYLEVFYEMNERIDFQEYKKSYENNENLLTII